MRQPLFAKLFQLSAADLISKNNCVIHAFFQMKLFFNVPPGRIFFKFLNQMRPHTTILLSMEIASHLLHFKNVSELLSAVTLCIMAIR